MARKRKRRGSVQVQECNGSLRLLWTYKSKRYTLALGLQNEPWYWKLANDRALWLEREIQYGQFNPEKLDHYRKALYGKDAPMTAVTDIQFVPLAELWQQYTDSRKSGKSPSTVRGYGWVERHIHRLPTDDLRRVQLILDAIARLKPGTQKRLLTQFSACAKWAQKAELITNNPFMGTAAAVKVPQRGTVENDIHPFSKTERDQIIQAFKNNRYYHHYAALVAFLFFTGARPSEVTPLQWKHIKTDHILFAQSRVYTGRGYQTKEGLKTQGWRRFPINHQLRAILDSLSKGESKALVFSSPEGQEIHWGNFTNRAWKGVMKTLPEIEYRNPYQMRHSFISHCREANISSVTIAEWVGNSAEMIDRVYARPTQACQVPEL